MHRMFVVAIVSVSVVGQDGDAIATVVAVVLTAVSKSFQALPLKSCQLQKFVRRVISTPSGHLTHERVDGSGGAFNVIDACLLVGAARSDVHAPCPDIA